MNLEDTVFATVKSFVDTDTLFTALDVSNAVKATHPMARHSFIRDIVRELFTTMIVPAGWDRTSIEVTIADGSKQIALLYHPISVSFDLDNLYNDQKRAQSSAKPLQVSGASALNYPSVTVVNPVPAPAHWGGALPPVTPHLVPVAQAATRDLWKNMFSSQPSLFPRK
jgi:hypothetical protein